MQENYTASRIVLAASGVDHDELVSIAEPLLSDLPKVARVMEPMSVYVGGEYRCQADSGVRPNSFVCSLSFYNFLSHF